MEYKLVPMDRSHLAGVAELERLCFSTPWNEAMQRAVNVGAVLRSSVSRRTDFLVVGHQYDGPDGQATISNKEEKARAILAEGKSKLRLLDETEFFHLLQSAAPSRAARPMAMAKVSGK